MIAYNLSDILPRSSVNIHWKQECDIASDFQSSNFLLILLIVSSPFCSGFFLS
nr:MAG TPA: hypothetical protein [Caudoviricetes sp.]